MIGTFVPGKAAAHHAGAPDDSLEVVVQSHKTPTFALQGTE